MSQKVFHIYTDGGCNVHSGKVGAWSYVIIDPVENDVVYKGCGVVFDTTNQRMELMAMVQAMHRAWHDLPEGDIVVHSDNMMVVNGVGGWVDNWAKNGWKTRAGEDVKFRDLWEQIIELKQKLDPTVKWVKAHSGVKWNELCDSIATTELNKQTHKRRNYGRK